MTAKQLTAKQLLLSQRDDPNEPLWKDPDVAEYLGVSEVGCVTVN